MPKLYSGVEGQVDLDKQDLLQLEVATDVSAGTVQIGDEVPVTIPASSTWNFTPQQRWYDVTIVFSGTTFYFVEAS